MASVQPTGGLRLVFASGATSTCRGRRQRLRNGVWRYVMSLLLLGASVVAAAPGTNAPSEYLDEETGATVFFVGQPLVFARERVTLNGKVALRESPSDPPDITHVPRDYVTLAAAAVDRGGKYTYVLVGYFWFVVALQPGDNDNPLL